MPQKTSQLQNLAAKISESTNRLSAWGQKPSIPARRPGSSVYKGGDPCDAFHSIRQFLLLQGIDTRVFSFGSIALPAGLNGANITDDMGTVDNSFYFEFHRMLTSDQEDMPKVNVLVLIVRCFFQDVEGRTLLHTQLVLNHDRDAIFELNEQNDYLIDMAQMDGWVQPYSSTANNRITYFEKTYTEIHEFKFFVQKMQKQLLLAYETVGNNLIPVANIT